MSKAEDSDMKEVQLGPKTLEIPQDWKTESFGKIYNKRNWKVNDPGEDTKYVGLEHIESNSTFLKDYEENGAKRSSSRGFKKGDILFGKLRPYLDKAAIAPFDGICSSDIIPIYAEEDSTNDYLKYLMHSKIIRDRVVSTMEGTNLPRTSWSALASTKIPLPPLPEQHRIASILSTVDDAIWGTDEVVERTRELKRGLMQDLLTKGTGHDEFKEVQLGPKTVEVPVEWDLSKIEEVFDVVKGHNYESKNYCSEHEGINFITLKAIQKFGGFNKKGIKYYKDLLEERYLVEPGDIIIANTDLNRDADVIGYPLQVPEFDNSLKTGFSMDVSALKFKRSNRYEAFYYYLLSTKIIHDAIEAYAEGSNVLHLDVDGFRRLEVPDPPLPEQRRIASILSTVDEKIREEQEHREQLQELKKGLMQDLLTGKVRVNESSIAGE